METALLQQTTVDIEDGNVEEEIEKLELSDGALSCGINIKGIPILSPEEEKALFQELDDGSKREKLIESNLRLVSFWAKRFKNIYPKVSLELSDFFQEGVMGLMRAVDHFDPRRGCKFSTYASYWIKQAMWRAMENKGFSIKFPVFFHNKVRQFLKVLNAILQRDGCEPSPEKMVEETEFSLKEVFKIQNILLTTRITSLDAPIINEEGEEGNSLIDFIADKETSPEEEAERSLLRETIDEILEEFTPRDRKIFKKRFGLDGGPHTLEEVGKEFCLNRERIRQIVVSILRKLRHPSRSGKLRDYLE